MSQYVYDLESTVRLFLKATWPFVESAAPHETGTELDVRNWEQLMAARQEAEGLLKEMADERH